MKKCPYCAEDIQDEAIKCRYCRANLIVKISKVAPDSLADKIKLQKDDVLLSINSKVTHSFKSVNNIKEKIDIGSPFNIKILRDGELLSLEATFSNNRMLGLHFYGKGDIVASTNSRQAAQLRPSRGGIMKNEPIIQFKGRNGRVELYNDFIRFDRVTVMGFLAQGIKGKKDIYFHNITSIQIKKPGLTAGYLQLSIPGGNESKKGIFDAITDENTIFFGWSKQYEMAQKIKEHIEKKIRSKNTNSVSSADEIEKLHSLMEKGILTNEEFEKKKKKLLEDI